MGISSSILSKKKGLKRVLLIGINYIEDSSNKLNGCINDIINIENKLRITNPECIEYRKLSDDQTNPLLKPTRKNIIDGINWLVTGLKSGESVLISNFEKGCTSPIIGPNELISPSETRWLARAES